MFNLVNHFVRLISEVLEKNELGKYYMGSTTPNVFGR